MIDVIYRILYGLYIVTMKALKLFFDFPKTIYTGAKRVVAVLFYVFKYFRHVFNLFPQIAQSIFMITWGCLSIFSYNPEFSNLSYVAISDAMGIPAISIPVFFIFLGIVSLFSFRYSVNFLASLVIILFSFTTAFLSVYGNLSSGSLIAASAYGSVALSTIANMSMHYDLVRRKKESEVLNKKITEFMEK